MYPEIMVIPMREELTRLGVEELRTAADVDRFVQKRVGRNHGGSEFHLRMRCGTYASRRAPRAAKRDQAREGCDCIRGQDREANRACPLVFHRIPPSSPSIAF